MNEAQRSVLQQHIKQLANDIMLTEELLATMYQRKLFEWNMIEAIKAEKTHTDQLYKMLHMLPKRGPEAFENFVDILKGDYPWLAATLEIKYRSELEMLSRQNTMCACTCGSMSARSETHTDGVKPSSAETPADPDIKTRVGMFIHKQFGHSKRISQHDKKMMEKWLSDQIQVERKNKRKQSAISEGPDVTERDSCTSPVNVLEPIQDDLKRVFEKVRDENLTDLLNSEHANKTLEENGGASTTEEQRDDGSMERSSDEVDNGANERENKDTAKLVGTTVSQLETEVDKLINRMNHMEGLIAQCHYILGDPDRKQKLANLVKEVQYTIRQYERDLGKEKVKAEKMLHEIYDFSKSIHKLENDKLHLRQERDGLTREIDTIKAQNAVLIDKNKVLEDANIQHLEKERTLANLRKMVDDLKSSHTSLADENSNYRINYGTGSFKTTRRPIRTSRRGSVNESIVQSVTRKPQTRVSISTTRKKPSIASRIP